jgi:hypothetical protein
MTQSNVEGGSLARNRRFHWETILPRRKDLIQTLILLPVGLGVANFMGSNWNFAISLIQKQQQYPLAILAIGFSVLMPSLFLACLLHWGRSIWYRRWETWYPNRLGLWNGFYATLTIGISCGLVDLFAQSLGLCHTSAASNSFVQPWLWTISQTLACNLDSYGFESKSWIGVWLIIAAYCYRFKGAVEQIHGRILNKSK